MLFPLRGSHQVSLVPEDSSAQKVSHWLSCFTLDHLASHPACHPLGLFCTRSELNAVVLNLMRHVWGTGAEREWECGVQMCEGESKAYQLLVPAGGGLFLFSFPGSAGEVIH